MGVEHTAVSGHTEEPMPREDGEERDNTSFPYFLIFNFFFDVNVLFLIQSPSLFQRPFLVICLNLLIKFYANIFSDALFKDLDFSSKNSAPFYVFSAYRPGSLFKN